MMHICISWTLFSHMCDFSQQSQIQEIFLYYKSNVIHNMLFKKKYTYEHSLTLNIKTLHVRVVDREIRN